MFERFATLVKSFLNSLMGKMETPELMIEKAADDLQTSVTQTRQALVQSMTTEKTLDAQIKKAKEEVAKWHERATMAVQQNNEETARQCLQKKQEAAQSLVSLEAQLETQKQTTAQLKQHSAKLEGDLQKFNVNKQNLLTRDKAAQAQEKASNLLPGSGVGNKMDELEMKIAQKEARAASLQELNQMDQAKRGAGNLDVEMDLDAELANLKALSGKPSQPKLISVDAEVVDEDDTKS